MKKFFFYGIALFFVFSITSSCSVTPNPYSADEFEDKSNHDLITIFSAQEKVIKNITLYEALARAIKYNLDHKVSKMEESIARGILVQNHYDLLPQIVTSAGYTSRNNENGSTSQSLLTNTQSLEASTSSERDNYTADVVTVWNLLDFGVGYQQARQQADQVLIAEENRRKAVQNIAQDVRLAYWQAVSAEILLPEMDTLLNRVESALKKSRQIESAKAQAPIKVLDYQQELVETVQQLWNMRRDLSLAKTELSNLINLKPGTKFNLETEQLDKMTLPDFSITKLEKQALINRPELRIEAYNTRIGVAETRKALLRMLPGLEFNVSSNYDNTKYLTNNSWLQAGLNLSWNAFNLFSAKSTFNNAKMQTKLAEQRHMAAAMMVLTQANLAYQHYLIAQKEYHLAQELNDIHLRKVYHAESAQKAKTGKELEEIRGKVAALSARMQLGVAFSELQSSIGRILNSIGIDPMPSAIESDDLRLITNLIKRFEQVQYRNLSSSTKNVIYFPFKESISKEDTTPEDAINFFEEPINTPEIITAPVSTFVPVQTKRKTGASVFNRDKHLARKLNTYSFDQDTEIDLPANPSDASSFIIEEKSVYNDVDQTPFSGPEFPQAEPDIVDIIPLETLRLQQSSMLKNQINHAGTYSYPLVFTLKDEVYHINGNKYFTGTSSIDQNAFKEILPLEKSIDNKTSIQPMANNHTTKNLNSENRIFMMNKGVIIGPENN